MPGEVSTWLSSRTSTTSLPQRARSLTMIVMTESMGRTGLDFSSAGTSRAIEGSARCRAATRYSRKRLNSLSP